MPFTVTDVIDRAQKLFDDEAIPSDLVCSWINECLVSIGSKAMFEISKVYKSRDKEWHILPPGFVSAVKVKSTIGPPSGLSVTPVGETGDKIYGYRVSARSAYGETLACEEVKIINGNAVLNENNYNTLLWLPVDGANGYEIYRTISTGTPSTTGYIGSSTTTFFNDTGLDGNDSSIPLEDFSGEEYFDYVIRNGKIMFKTAGNYVLNYLSAPQKVAALSDTINLPEVFINPLIKFVVARYKGMDNINNQESVALMKEYFFDLNNALSEFEYSNDIFQVKEVW